MQQLIGLLEHLGQPRIVLFGDFMLDRYVFGDTERISPEAPVPVLKVVKETSRGGGAGNVAAAILALGGKVVCVGVRGDDAPGEELRQVLVTAGAEVSPLIRLGHRSTIIKTRYVGLAQHRNAQQILRVDVDPPGPIAEDVSLSLLAAVRGEARSCGLLAIQDHDKGVVTPLTAPKMIAEARKASIPAVVDPARIEDYRRYRGATLLTPNRYEAQLASGVEVASDASLEKAARRVLDAADADAVVITLDKDGAFLLSRDGQARHLPTRPRSVYDGTGAGDEVLAMLSVAMAAGCDLEQAAALANVAGGLEVERFGVVPITRQEVIDDLRYTLGLRGNKTMGRQRLAEELARRRERGETVVFTNGCFDLLHMGHVRYLQQARRLGSLLVVGINSDDSARRLKGPSRPVIGQEERAEMLGSLECVDYVTIFDEDTPEVLLDFLRPEILAKGGTTPVVVGREFVEGYGGRVLTLDLVEGLSTTNIIERIVAANQRQ